MTSMTDKIVALCLVVCLFGATVLACRNSAQALKQEEVEPAAGEVYDTTYLERWCGEPSGTIRMVGGWVFNTEDNTTVLEDESGNLWVVRDVELDEDDFLLLWIDNHGTPDYLEDDEVVKTWREAR